MADISTTVEAVQFDLVVGAKIAKQAELILSLNQELQALKNVNAVLVGENKKLSEQEKKDA